MAQDHGRSEDRSGGLEHPIERTRSGHHEALQSGFVGSRGHRLRSCRAGAGQISVQAGQGRGAVRRRQRDRHRDPHRRRSVAPRARPAVRDREQARRLRHPRHRGNGEGQARRLHAAGRQSRHQRADADHLQGQVQDRLRQRGRHGVAARRGAAHPRRHHQGLRAQELRRVHRAGQGQSRQGALRQRRRRQQQPLRHRGVRAVGRPQAHSHPEQGRRRGDHQRSGERATRRWRWSTPQARPA